MQNSPMMSLVTSRKTSSIVDIRTTALALVKFNQDADPGIKASYLFPSESEIRLIHLDENTPATASEDTIAPFYFGPDRSHGIPYPSAVAIIRPEEKGRLPLPQGWGDWEAAEEISRELN